MLVQEPRHVSSGCPTSELDSIGHSGPGYPQFKLPKVRTITADCAIPFLGLAIQCSKYFRKPENALLLLVDASMTQNSKRPRKILGYREIRKRGEINAVWYESHPVFAKIVGGDEILLNSRTDSNSSAHIIANSPSASIYR